MFKSNKGLTAHELNQCLTTDPVTKKMFNGVYCADEIPICNVKHSCFISNTDITGLPGSHWVAFYFPKKGPPEYFDSVGNPPGYYHTFFEDVLVLGGPQYLQNSTRVQGKNSVSCGAFCIYYLYYRCRGVAMASIVESFDLTEFSENDYMTLDLVNKIGQG